MPLTLSRGDRARLDDLVARELRPYTLVVAKDRFTLEEVPQDVFPGVRVLRMDLATMPLKKRAYLAAGDTWSVLTGHIDSYNLLAAGAAQTVSSFERARHVARLADTWTTTWEHGQLEVASFAEIPWRTWIEADERARIEAARANIADQIAPEQLACVDGEYVITTWVVAHAKLLRRTLGVTFGGRFRRSDEVMTPSLPIPLGRYWRVVDGRLIPTG